MQIGRNMVFALWVLVFFLVFKAALRMSPKTAHFAEDF